MNNEVKFSSKRFLLTLSLSACSVILLLNTDRAFEKSLTFCLLSLSAGFLVSLLMFLPSAYIKLRTDSDFLSLSRQALPNAKLPLAILYSAYFIYLIQYFFLPYTDMFHKNYYSEANIYLVMLIFMGVCCFAAYRGTNAITRFSIFLFVFSVIVKLIVFSGSIDALDFKHYGFNLDGDANDFISQAVLFATPAFVAVLFGCLSGKTRNFSLRQPVIIALFGALEFALVLFFVFFSLGDYAYAQQYQTFSLSHASHLGSFGGFESFYLALTTLTVFMVISLALCCINRFSDRENDLKNTIIFTAISLVMSCCSLSFSSVKELLTDKYLFVSASIVFAVIIPSIIFALYRRNGNV